MLQKNISQKSKCYCNSVGSICCNGYINCLKGRAGSAGSAIRSESIFSVANKSKNNKQPNQRDCTIRNTEKNKVPKADFVKLNRKATASNRRGLGHSYATQNPAAAVAYSRRNSAATNVTFSTAHSVTTLDDMASRSSKMTTPTSIGTPSPTPAIKLKSTPVTMATLSDNFRALNVTAKGNNFAGKLQPEYTEQRLTYENIKQLIKLLDAQGDSLSSLNSVDSDIYATDSAADVHHLRALQEFRLKNTDDCFSVYRQLDLRLPKQQKFEMPALLDQQQQIRKLLSTLLERNENVAFKSGKQIQRKELCVKTSAGNVKLAVKEKPKTTLTPYAVRQKLLQIRMEADEIGRMKPGRKLCDAMGNSFALRYQ